MKQRFLAGLVGVWLGVAGFAQTTPVYHNIGTVQDNPAIDATVFINSGLFEVNSGALYDTQDTLDYTNVASAYMSSYGGFRFIFQTNEFQYPARSFNNQGSIQGGEITILATNLVNGGTLQGQNSDLIHLEGDWVNLSRGGIESDSSGIMEVYNSYGTLTYYVANGTNNAMRGDVMTQGAVDISGVNLPFQGSPIHDVEYESGGLFGNIRQSIVPLRGGNPNNFAAFTYTNMLSPTSMVVKVLIVNTNLTDPNMSIQAGFLPITSVFDNSAQAIVQWYLPDVDIISGQPFTNYVTLIDNLPNIRSNYIISSFSTGTIDNPLNYTLDQGHQTQYPPSMINTNATFSQTLIVPTPTNSTIVTNTYAGWYGAVGLNTVATVPQTSSESLPINPALFDPTNSAARVEVLADSLDLSNARLRAGSILKITATNLVGNVGCQLDAPVVRYDIGNTNGLLSISNLAPVTISRIVGSIQVYSEVWTNSFDSATVDSTGAAVTNTVTLYGYAMYLDHSLSGVRQVQVYDASFHSTNVSIYDNMFIVKAFTLDAESFYNAALLNGDALVSRDWSDFSRLNYITNDSNGVIDTGSGNFVDVRTNPIVSFVNVGTINSAGIHIRAASIQNSGMLNTSYPNAGAITLEADQAKLDGGNLNASSDVTLNINNLKARQATITANTLFMSVPKVLTDGGPVDVTEQNNWTCFAGFNLAVLPQQSDLRGTRILTTAGKWASVPHSWAGKNYGLTNAGYTNNAALGGLILDGSHYSQFVFNGTSTNTYITNAGVKMPANAMYVDYLEFRDYATNLTDSVVIGDNLVIYFAAASMPAEQLDGLFNGHLRWIRSYAGPASSQTINQANGQTIVVNSSLANSETIDSNGDGVVNALDPYPFDVYLVDVTLAGAGSTNVSMSWNGAAQTVYFIDSTTNLFQGGWVPVQSVTNSLNTNVLMTVKVPKSNSANDQYYRVRYAP